MSERDEHFARLLLIYPKAYREERGEEILGTLLDASPSHKSYPALRDVLEVTLHGMQMRLGLTPDRFVGRVLALAAMPGLVIAPSSRSSCPSSASGCPMSVTTPRSMDRCPPWLYWCISLGCWVQRVR